MNQYFGLQYDMMSRHRWTRASAAYKFLGVLALLLAMLYCVHGGEHQMTSGASNPKYVYSHDNRSWHTSAPHLGSLSRDITSCPAASHGCPTLPVPLQMSQRRMAFLYQAVVSQTSSPHDGWGALLQGCPNSR